MAIRKENVRRALSVMGAGGDAECGQAGRAEELGVNDQRTNGHAVSVVAEFVEPNVLGRGEANSGVIEQGGVAGVAIVEAALGLARADVGELGVGVYGLIAAGAEEDFRLVAEVFLEQQAQADRSAAAQGDQAGGGAGGWVEIEGASEWGSFGAVRDLTVVVAGIGMDSQAHLPQVGETGSLPAFFTG